MGPMRTSGTRRARIGHVEQVEPSLHVPNRQPVVREIHRRPGRPEAAGADATFIRIGTTSITDRRSGRTDEDVAAGLCQAKGHPATSATWLMGGVSAVETSYSVSPASQSINVLKLCPDARIRTTSLSVGS
ncbi:MAG: hypothetical protein IPG72_03530 [Ardenticatenales bacterium]|nr:hypothetical protein [Ardenticatenales bacterium]